MIIEVVVISSLQMEWVHEQRGDAANPDADVVQTPLTVNYKAKPGVFPQDFNVSVETDNNSTNLTLTLKMGKLVDGRNFVNREED
jgi:hypothetical protein